MRQVKYKTKEILGKKIKIITNSCNRKNMGGAGPCCMSMFLHVNNYCNANCSFCIIERGPRREISNFTKLEKSIAELIDKRVVSKVVLTGGEPLLHSRFKDFLTMLDNFNLQWYSLNTNGILLYDFIDKINHSNLKHINISFHHYTDEINKRIMGNCLTFDDVERIRKIISNNIEIRLACTITKFIRKESDIMAYINKAKSIGINNVIFRKEYRGINQKLDVFKKIWNNLFYADICNCGYKLINGVNTEYRESNIKLKQMICDANLYFRDFIYKDDDVLSGSWEYGSQVII